MNAALLFQLYLFGRMIRKQTTGEHGGRILEATVLWLCQKQQRTITQLSALLGISISTTSETVNAIVSKGLLSERVNQADKRQSLLTITVKGKRYLEDIVARMDQLCSPLVDSLSPEEKSILTLLLGKLLST